MPPLSTYLLFVAAAVALLVTPGPAVLFIVARSAHQGRKAGFVSALGIAAGGLVHVAGAVLGFSALLVSSSLAFSAVRWAGAAYLVWLGIRTIRDGASARETVAPPPTPLRRIFVQGFWVNVLNPKTALFFLALLPQFVDPSRGRVPLQMLFLGLSFVSLAIVSDGCYAMLAGTIARRGAWSRVAQRRASLVTGGVYVALGVGAAAAGADARS